MKLISILLIFLTSCCAQHRFESQTESHHNLKTVLETAAAQNFIRQEHQTKKFKLTTFSHITDNQHDLIVYLEGDGHSRESKYELSNNPTPHQPLGLELALKDPRPNILYIARPGQYTHHDPQASNSYWSTHRFSKEVINSTNEIVNRVKNPHQKIKLIGFSGGGGLAVLVAAHRVPSDISHIMTIAGDLNHVAMTKYHHTSPLTHSLNPIHFAKALKHIPQLHLAGKHDPIVPKQIALGYIKESNTAKVQMRLVEASHHEGWLKHLSNNKFHDTL